MIGIEKYPRTYHFPFSPGAKNDDRIAKEIDEVCKGKVIFTEKLDGSNTACNRYGIFGRSRAAETTNPWDSWLKERYNLFKGDLGDLEICGENMYGEHSIRYSNLDSYFYIFGIRDISRNVWLSWEEVEFYANMLDFPTVPVLDKTGSDWSCTAEEMEEIILKHMSTPSILSNDKFWITEKEGVVVRVAVGFSNDDFYKSIIKYVRKNHVQTDEHWQRNWKRAKLNYELR